MENPVKLSEVAQGEKLNLGCGRDIRDGWVNLDIAPLNGVNVVHDLTVLPLPFKNEQFSEICAKDVLEHLDYIPLLRDIHRILKPGGTLNIQVPHFTSADNYIDPTHTKRFSIRTFDFFVKKGDALRSYYFDFGFQAIHHRKLHFHRGPLVWDYVVELLVNTHFKIQKYYELTFLCRIFPAQNIALTFIK